MAVCLAASLAISGTLPSQASAELNEIEHTILAHGIGELMVSPDSVSLTMGIDSEAKTLKEANEENSIKMDAIQKVLRDAKFKNFKLKTVGFNSYPVHNSRSYRGGMNKITGYHVSHRLKAIIEDVSPEELETLGEQLLNTVMSQEVNHVDQLQFYLNHPDAPQKKAMKRAFEQAKNQAEILANVAGYSINGVYAMEGMRHYPMSTRGFAREMALDVAESSPNPPKHHPKVLVGQQKLRAEVHVRFNFE
jgi:hypothetical protein